VTVSVALLACLTTVAHLHCAGDLSRSAASAGGAADIPRQHLPDPSVFFEDDDDEEVEYSEAEVCVGMGVGGCCSVLGDMLALEWCLLCRR
jgi:hypothetical protein